MLYQLPKCLGLVRKSPDKPRGDLPPHYALGGAPINALLTPDESPADRWVPVCVSLETDFQMRVLRSLRSGFSIRFGKWMFFLELPAQQILITRPWLFTPQYLLSV